MRSESTATTATLRVTETSDPGQARTWSVDGNDRVDDDRDVQRRGSLPWGGAGVPACLAPQPDDHVAEPVHDCRVLSEPGCAMDIAHRSQPLGDAVKVAERVFERGEDRQRGQTRRLI